MAKRGKAPESIIARLAAAAKPRAARAKRLVARIAAEDRARRRAAFRIGQCLAALHRERLWANLGYRRLEELLASLGIGRAQAFKLIAVAERSSAAVVEEVGVEAAYASVTRAGRRGMR